MGDTAGNTWVTHSLYAPAWDHHGHSFPSSMAVGSLYSQSNISSLHGFNDTAYTHTASPYALLPSPSAICPAVKGASAHFSLSPSLLSNLPKLQSLGSTASQGYSSQPSTPVVQQAVPATPSSHLSPRPQLDMNLPPCSPQHSATEDSCPHTPGASLPFVQESPVIASDFTGREIKYAAQENVSHFEESEDEEDHEEGHGKLHKHSRVDSEPSSRSEAEEDDGEEEEEDEPDEHEDEAEEDQEEGDSLRQATPPRRHGGSVKTCVCCGTWKTPLWRNGPPGPKSLCNACGIRFNKIRMGKRRATKEEEALLRKFEHNLPPSHKYSAHQRAAAAAAAATKAATVSQRKVAVPVAAVHKARSKLPRHTSLLVRIPGRALGHDPASSGSEVGGSHSPADQGEVKARKRSRNGSEGQTSSGGSCLSEQHGWGDRNKEGTDDTPHKLARGEEGQTGSGCAVTRQLWLAELRADADDVQYGAQLLMSLLSAPA